MPIASASHQTARWNPLAAYLPTPILEKLDRATDLLAEVALNVVAPDEVQQFVSLRGGALAFNGPHPAVARANTDRLESRSLPAGMLLSLLRSRSSKPVRAITSPSSARSIWSATTAWSRACVAMAGLSTRFQRLGSSRGGGHPGADCVGGPTARRAPQLSASAAPAPPDLRAGAGRG